MGLLPKILRADKVLHAILHNCRVEEGSAYVSLFSIWETIAGIHVAAHCKPVDVQHGSLIVETDNPAWTAELQYKRRSILAALHKRLPELGIQNIRVHLTRA